MSKFTTEPILRVEDLTVAYRLPGGRRQLAIDGVTFDIAAGEAVGLLGESGCGKTTLGLALLGLLPTAGSVIHGSVIFRGENLLSRHEHELQEIRGAAISMVYQEPGAALNPVLRVGDQITEVIRAHRRFSRVNAENGADAVLAQVGFSKESWVAAAFPHQLSGGQLQRVAIAQAIACRPALVIADEPTTALDRRTQLEILDLLATLRENLRLGLLLIAHDSSVLARIVDRVMVMRAGRIVEQGLAKNVIQESRVNYTRVLLKAPSVGTCPLNDGPMPTARPDGNPQPLLRAVNLRKRYVQGRWLLARRHQIEALRGVDLTLRKGSTLALIGASGSGKSTLARCLACLERPDHGEVWIGHSNLVALSRREMLPHRRQIQMIFQDPGSSLNPRFCAVEIISEPLLTAGVGTKKERRERCLALMELVGLRAEWGDRLPHQFSAGQRRRLAIARALALEPTLLILDEALAGLDLPVQARIANLLLKLQATLSLTYLYISHDLDLAARLADEIAVMSHGQIVEIAKPTGLLAEPRSLPASSLVWASVELCGCRD